MIERIKTIMNYYNLSVNTFAAKISANQVTVNQQVNGDRKISLDTVLKTINSFELISAEWLLRGKGEMCITDKPSSLEISAENAEITRLRIENNLLREMVGLNNSQKEKGKAV